jgi:epoxyqueuosine reductase
VPPLINALYDEEPLLRGHAAWALGEAGGSTAMAALEARLRFEEDDWVKSEIRLALAGTSRADRRPNNSR